MSEVDVTIIGAGVVGLAIAVHLTAPGRRVFVLEKNRRAGEETSSRNSQVIHSGIYYPLGTLKSRLCIAGNRLLYDWCETLHVPHRRIGKLILAAEGQESDLLRLKANGENGGVAGIQWLDRSYITALEPQVCAQAALFVPATGLVDAGTLVHRLVGALTACEGDLIVGTRLIAAEPRSAGYRLTVQEADGERFSYDSQVVINAAGLYADQVAAMTGIDIDAAGYRLHFAKGNYFSVQPAKATLLSRPVYPLPERELAGLGIHATPDLDGRLRLGPDVEWLDESWRNYPTYTVDSAKHERFWQSVHRWLPALDPTDLQAEMAGVRPKLQGPGEPVRDFVVRHEVDRGLIGWVNLIGIESPGLTASPALAAYVAQLLVDLL
ncbi:MAG: NAD(P)/FAD-dependent oxidoreductase [Firmicutes bacterium]|nr:NAD(P)/FAD-dependent oxidoreductase [Bacillota bacterium]